MKEAIEQLDSFEALLAAYMEFMLGIAEAVDEVAKEYDSGVLGEVVALICEYSIPVALRAQELQDAK